MIGTSLPEYVFIRTSIAILQLVTPCSFIYVAYFAAAQPTTRWQASLGVYAVVEILFYILVYLPRRYLLQKVRVLRVYDVLTEVALLACSTSLYSLPRTPAHTFSTMFQPFGNIRSSFRMVLFSGLQEG